MKNNPVLNAVNQVVQGSFYGLVFLAPLLVLPFTRNLVVDTKLLMLFVATLVVLLGFAVRTLLQKRWELAISPFTAPLWLFGLTVAFSTFLTNRYPAEALLGLGGAYFALVLLGVFGSSLIKGNHTRGIITTLGASGSLLSISMLLQQFGWGPTRLINSISAFNLPHNLLFNLSGSSFVAIQVLALSLVGLIGWSMLKKNVSVLDATMIAINTIGLALGAWSAMPGNVAAVTLTPLAASWTVLMNSLSTLPGALIGRGPASYNGAYAQFKPLWTNGQDYWQFNFGTATETILTLGVTLGLLGLAAWLFLAWQAAQQTKNTNNDSKPLLWMLLGTFLIQVLVPTNVVVLTLQIALLVFWVAANQNHFSLLQFKTVRFRSYPAKFEFVKKLTSKANKNNWFINISGAVMVVLVAGLGYLLTRASLANYYMYRSNVALQNNDAIEVYENQRLAVRQNPYVDSLRRDYALTNMQVAIALSNNADITEEEQQQVIQLISQAVREGRAATVLDSDDIDNWLVLAEVYRNLIGAADEAQNWAVSSLVNAVQINPINPLLRLEIGQLALTGGSPQDAIRFFSQAIELKPDLPAGYYQLGIAYRELGQLENTRLAWQQALTLLAEGSQDHAALTQQLATLESEIATPAVLEDEDSETTPNVTEQNVQQTESDVVTPGEDAQLN